MKKLRFLCGILLILSLSACQQATPSEDGTLEQVTLILDYKPNTNHTGFYVAQEKGYFAEAGLDVTIIEPAEGAVTSLVAAGKGEFGISYQEDVTYARTAQEPVPIRAIAAIIQHNTSGFASFAEKGIERPLDFEGKVYSGWGAPSEEAVIRAVMAADGADPDTLTIVNSDGSGFAALKEKIDLMWFFWAWDGIASQRNGVPVNYIELREFDARLDYYTPVIFASEETLEKRGDMTKQFLKAVTRGYEYAMAEPKDAAEILSQYVPEYDVEMLIESQEYLAEKYQEDAARWGEMKESVWADYMEFMVENDLIDQSTAPSDCFTNEYLPE